MVGASTPVTAFCCGYGADVLGGLVDDVGNGDAGGGGGDKNDGADDEGNGDDAQLGGEAMAGVRDRHCFCSRVLSNFAAAREVLAPRNVE